MSAAHDTLVKWVPIDGIPQSLPSEVIVTSGTGGGTEVNLRFPHAASGVALVIRFTEVAALQAFEKFSDTYWGANFSLRFADYPMWIVTPSAWIAEFSNFTLSHDLEKYVHYFLGGFDGTLHILTASIPEIAWVNADY